MEIEIDAPHIDRIQRHSLELIIQKWARPIPYITSVEIEVKGSYSGMKAREKVAEK